MSYEAMTWAARIIEDFPAWKPPVRFVLLIMANRADEEGVLFPAVRWIQKRTGLGESTIREATRQIAKAGLLIKEIQKREDGGQSSNRYRLAMNQYVLRLDPPPSSGGGVLPHGPGVLSDGGGRLQQQEGPGPAPGPQETKEEKKEKSVARPTASPVGKSPAAKAFNSYSGAFYERYQVEPPVSARVRGQFSQLVARIGAERASAVAVAYVRDDNEFYRRVKHSPGILLKDCERIDVELRQAEKARAAREDRWWEDPAKVAERAKREGIKPIEGDSYARMSARLFVKLGDGPWMHKLDPLVAKYVREYSTVEAT